MGIDAGGGSATSTIEPRDGHPKCAWEGERLEIEWTSSFMDKPETHRVSLQATDEDLLIRPKKLGELDRTMRRFSDVSAAEEFLCGRHVSLCKGPVEGGEPPRGHGTVQMRE